MKLKKSTVLLLASALILGTGVFIYEVTIAPQLEEDKLQNQKVFNFELDQVESLTLETPERTLEFNRVESKTQSTETQWEMTILQSSTKSELNGRKPIPANEAYVSFLISLLVNAQSDRQILISANQKAEYGLDKPQATIDFTLKTDQSYKLVLGKRDFSDNFLYAIANPPENANAQSSVILLPINFENGVNRPLSEWKAESEPLDKNQPKSEVKPENNTSKPNSDATSEEPSPGNNPPNEEKLDPSTPEATPATPKSEAPESQKSEQEKPESEQTESEKPEVDNSNPEKSDSEKQELEKSNSEKPKFETPKSETPASDKSNSEKPKPEESTPSPASQKVEEPLDSNTPKKEDDTTSPE